ncbi:MAG: hypothetical protein KF729_16325, partial [Sandaracinaceae bacterium]|nr:hypothetical protein [Sandaracinaceae bacterium]
AGPALAAAGRARAAPARPRPPERARESRRASGGDDDWRRDPDLTEDDRDLLEELTERATLARERLRLAEETLREQRRELAALAQRLEGERLPPRLRAELELALVWASWRAGHPSAGELAEHFTAEHASAGDLLAIAWMIRGEVAAAEQLPEEALAAFRFGANRMGEPLYAYSLWRTAAVQRAAGNAAAARESLIAVEREACARGAPELVRRLAYDAASALGHGVRADADGVLRPEVCPPMGAAADRAGWRPEE